MLTRSSQKTGKVWIPVHSARQVHSPVEQGSAEWGYPMHGRNLTVLWEWEHCTGKRGSVQQQEKTIRECSFPPRTVLCPRCCFFKVYIQSWQQHLPVISPFSICKGMHSPPRWFLLSASPCRKYMHFEGMIPLIYYSLRRRTTFWLDKSHPKDFV